MAQSQRREGCEIDAHLQDGILEFGGLDALSFWIFFLLVDILISVITRGEIKPFSASLIILQ